MKSAGGGPDETSDLTAPTGATALAALEQPGLPADDEMQLAHDIWCHPGNDKFRQIYKAMHGKGFSRGFLQKLSKFQCATCAVSKRTR